ncbi:MAG: dUTP diphosphatase [Candidatus Nanoarchaeia archaeon]
MQKPYLKIKRLRDDVILPSKRSEDAGYDIYTILDEPFLILKPGEIHRMPTGLSFEIPQDWVFYVVERSSTGMRGIAQRSGVLDSGFRGELQVPLNNSSNKPIVFYKEEEKLDEFLEENNLNKEDIILYPLTKAIAQGMLLYCPHVDVEEVDNLSDSSRGAGAWGSSGK